MNTSDMKE